MNPTLTGTFQGLTALNAKGRLLGPKTLKFTPRLFGFRLAERKVRQSSGYDGSGHQGMLHKGAAVGTATV